MDEDINQKLYDAANRGEYEKVSALISRGASPEWTDGSGRSALHYAACIGRDLVARLLLDHGWQLDRANNWGWTPLHHAAYRGQVSTLQLLAARGAKINTQDNSKETPLHKAADGGHPAAVRLLLSLGADRRVKNDEDKTAEELCEDEETRAVFTEIPDHGAAGQGGHGAGMAHRCCSS